MLWDTRGHVRFGEDGPEFLFHTGVGEVAASDLVILFYDLLPGVPIFQQWPDLGHQVLGQKSVHQEGLKPARLDVGAIDGVAIGQDWFFEIDGFQESVAEAFISGWVTEQIGVVVGLPDGIKATVP